MAARIELFVDVGSTPYLFLTENTFLLRFPHDVRDFIPIKINVRATCEVKGHSVVVLFGVSDRGPLGDLRKILARLFRPAPQHLIRDVQRGAGYLDRK